MDQIHATQKRGHWLAVFDFLAYLATVSFSVRTLLTEVRYFIIGSNKPFVGTFPSGIIYGDIQC